MGKRRAEPFSAYSVLGEGERPTGAKVQRPRSVFFQIIFYGRWLDRLSVICYTKMSIVREKSSFNQKSGFSLLRGSALLQKRKESGMLLQVTYIAIVVGLGFYSVCSELKKIRKTLEEIRDK